MDTARTAFGIVAPARCRCALLALVWGCLVWLPHVSVGAPPRPVVGAPAPDNAVQWSFERGETPFRVEQHERTTAVTHRGAPSEHVIVSAGQGSQILLGQSLAQARVIDELEPGVWVKASRVGLQAAVRVVLPRAIDPATGQPLAFLLLGTAYTDRGSWQRLSVGNLPRQVGDRVRLLRLEHGAAVDGREAIVDRFYVNVCGGPGVTEVWLDDLEIAGHVAAEPLPDAARRLRGSLASSGGSPGAAAREARGPRIEFRGGVLLVDERPFFPRAIEHRGEPLELLARVGFNVVKVHSAPTAALLSEAQQTGQWLICPPPRPAGLDDPAAPPAELAPLGAEFDRVLAWDLGAGLDRADLTQARRWVEAIRSADQRVARPLLAAPEADLRGYSRLGAVLLSGRRALGSSLELNDLCVWIRERPRLARPGTPFWTEIQTEPAPALLDQLAVLAGGRRNWSVESEQVRLLTHAALSAGVRGLVFTSSQRLDADDPATRQRATTLERINIELQLIDPWIAAGVYVATVPSNVPEVYAAVLQTDRARLMLPMWMGRGGQYVPGQAAANAVSFVAPGIPESSDAFEVTPAGMRTLHPKRVTGGTRITLDEFGLTSLVVLTQDPAVLSRLRQRLTATAPRAVELERALAADKLAAVVEIDGRAAERSRRLPQAPVRLEAARASLTRVDAALAGGDIGLAFLEAQRATRPLRMLAREHWQQAIAGLSSPVSSPLAVSFGTLIWQFDLQDRLARASAGENLLAGGDFETLDRTVRSGWQHFQYSHPGLQSGAELATSGAHGGQGCLRLRVAPVDSQQSPGLVESPPLWVTSASTPTQAGALYRIRGWIQVPGPVTGSIEGAMVFDSLAGLALAERVGQTDGWREFVLYRFAPRAQPLFLTVALSGLGEVLIDDVTIERLEPPATVPSPALAPR